MTFHLIYIGIIIFANQGHMSTFSNNKGVQQVSMVKMEERDFVNHFLVVSDFMIFRCYQDWNFYFILTNLVLI